MPPLSITTVLQVLLALGLLNVWLVRSVSATRYRGGGATSLRDEFSAYGLPSWAFYAVGALKLGSAAALLTALWVPALAQPAAGLVAVLMIGAVAMHVRVGDPGVRFLPALAMLVMSALVVVLH